MLKTYEGLFIFSSSLKEEALQEVLKRVREEITKLKGDVKEPELLGKRMFARPMKKRESGQYVRINFGMDPERIAGLRARFKLIEDIFRVQIMRVDERKSVPVPDAKEVEADAKS